MKKINLSDIEWTERVSPKGRYRLLRKELSVELGTPKHVGTWGGGHPFEVELVRLPSGAVNWPLHAHCAQWEFYVILSGEGTLHKDGEDISIGAGDCFMLPPDSAHNMTSGGGEDLVYYIIADNEPSDVVRYPNTGKWFIKPVAKAFKVQEVGYYEGEE